MHELGEKAANKKFRLSTKMKTEFDQETTESAATQRNVKFSDRMVDPLFSRKKHRSTSILKKRSISNFEKGKTRSESINSMSGQSPKDDQSCENSNLNKVIKDQYATLLQIYGKKGHYVDEIFPPVISSLFSYAGRKKNKAPQTFKWMRISQVFADRDLIMWGPDPSKNNIISSSGFASKYLVQGFNCIKGSKDLLRKMFETQKPNLQGVYLVKIFQGCIWKYVIIDDNIPVIEVPDSKKQKYMPAFVNCQLKNIGSKKQPVQIWPFLLQKAYAKQYSSYEALQNGNIFDFLEEATNQACEYYSLDNKDINLKEMFKNPETLAFAENTAQDSTPLFCNVGHSNKISFIKGNKQKVIINPQELPQYFTHLYILGWRKFGYFGQCPIRQARESISVRYFEIKNPMIVGLTLNQKDQRHFQENIKYHYSWIRMMVLQKEFNGGYRWIDGRYDNQKSMTIETEFEVGEYYIVIMPEWQSRAYDLNLIIRAKMPVRMERKAYEEGMIEAGCTDLAQRFGRLNQINNYICSYNCVHEDLGMVIQNINNQRMRGYIRILRSLDSLKSSLPIEVFNKEFKKKKEMQIVIKNNDHYTVILLMKGGIDREFFENFNFNGK